MVRGVNAEALQMLRDVQAISGGTLGELLNEAIACWYDSLPDTDDDSPSGQGPVVDGLSANQSHLEELIRQLGTRS
jgi:hypothetical protein